MTHTNGRLIWGVTTSRATSGGGRKDRNTSGQRGNNFNTSYRNISVVVVENNDVVKPKCQQYTSLHKMLSNFSKVLIAHISFTAVINNGGIGKGIGGIRKAPRRIVFTFCDLLHDVRDEKRKPKPWCPNNSSSLPQKVFKFFATSPVPVRRSGQASMVTGLRIAANYGS